MLLLASIAFDFEHKLWLAGILAGLAYGGLYIRSGTLWSPILVHTVINLLLGFWVIATGSWGFWQASANADPNRTSPWSERFTKHSPGAAKAVTYGMQSDPRVTPQRKA